jgi:hypothetical protein
MDYLLLETGDRLLQEDGEPLLVVALPVDEVATAIIASTSVLAVPGVSQIVAAAAISTTALLHGATVDAPQSAQAVTTGTVDATAVLFPPTVARRLGSIIRATGSHTPTLRLRIVT